MRRFENRVAIVTGGAQGLGRAYSARLAQEGAAVVVADLDADRADATAEEIAHGGAETLAVALDVTDQRSVADLVAQVADRFPTIDVLVNNAGVYWHRELADLTLGEWRQLFAVNVEGTFLVTQAVAARMCKAGYGRIVNISSGVVWIGAPIQAHYTASKAAVIGFTRSVANELAEHGITVNAVSPGLVLTERVERELAHAKEEAVALQAIKRNLRVEDIVGAVAFLASDEAAMITGQNLNVDGGQSMG
ncbi:MAG: glucose 1-dehydrogenase [Actinomycetia bacterium]|nr:glucose 1-dehydrogenase [Actinomycetes bacterium]